MALETIAIVGGGIGGLASAIFLSRKGYKVTVYDKAQSPRPVGAGFLLQPPGQVILNELGVVKDILQEAVPISGLQSKTVSGRKILDLKYSRLKGQSRNGLGVQRSTIYKALLLEAQKRNNVIFAWNSNIGKCINHKNKVTVIANQNEREYDLCILASGSNSHLADEQFKDRIKKPYGWGCFWTTIDLPTNLSPNTLHQRCRGSDKMMGILPVRKVDEKYEAALYWSSNSQTINSMSPNKFDGLKNEIMDFWPEASSSVKPLNCADFISANYNDVWMPKPFNNRLIAIGDISHATSPQLGQGCTMALLDAWSLANVIEDEAALENALEYWWSVRRKQLAYVRHLSKVLTPLFQSESRLCEIFRDWVMAPIGRLPMFDTLQLKTLASEVFLTEQNLP